MSNIKETAHKIIDDIYRLNPGIPVEVLLITMVSEGIVHGLKMASDILDGPEAAQLLSHKHTLNIGEIKGLLGKLK